MCATTYICQLTKICICTLLMLRDKLCPKLITYSEFLEFTITTQNMSLHLYSQICPKASALFPLNSLCI